MTLHVVVPAAGSGERLGETLPKALVDLAGRPLLAWTLEALAALEFSRGVVLAPPGWEAPIGQVASPRFSVAGGGATRAESVSRGVAQIEPLPSDWILIHDAARPFLAPSDANAVIAAALRSGAAIAVHPVTDTLKRAEEGWIRETLDRSSIVAAATPQVFRADLLARALSEAPPATDEAARVERLGVAVAAVPVSRRTFKITFPEDLEIAREIAEAEHESRRRR